MHGPDTFREETGYEPNSPHRTMVKASYLASGIEKWCMSSAGKYDPEEDTLIQQMILEPGTDKHELLAWAGEILTMAVIREAAHRKRFPKKGSRLFSDKARWIFDTLVDKLLPSMFALVESIREDHNAIYPEIPDYPSIIEGIAFLLANRSPGDECPIALRTELASLLKLHAQAKI